MTPSSWIALALNIALPAYTAFRYAQYAWDPGWYDDDYGLALLTLYAAQFPVTFLGGVFAGVSYIEGPSWRRVLVYVVVVALVGGLSGLVKVVAESDLAPIVGWAIALQVVMLMFVGSQPALALARIEAVTTDAVNLTVLAAYVALLAIAAGIALLELTGGIHAAHHPINVTWTDLAWIGAFYFALRAWSVAYAFTPAFEVRRKGFFDRPWIDRAARLWKVRPSGTD
ncbi:MAG: hypothetical protein ABI585_00570 [Betaproteobacteria bacterium]